MRTSCGFDEVLKRLLAERQMGAFLKEMPKSTGARGPGPNAVAEKDRINGLTTLADIGVSKDQSSRAQKLASMAELEFTSGSPPGTRRVSL